MVMWKNNKLDGNVIVIENGKYKKQFWENGKASKSLPIDAPIFFEKYMDKYIKKSKKNKTKRTLDE